MAVDNRKSQEHWAAQTERGSRFFLWLTTKLVRYCPHWALYPIVKCISFYFYATAPKVRRNIRTFHQRLRTAYPDLPPLSVYRQFASFADAICARFAVWQKKITRDDIIVHRSAALDRAIEHRRPDEIGQILICSHLGNIEMTRAFLDVYNDYTLNVLVHDRHAQAFNEALQKAGANPLNLIQVTDLDASMMLELKNRLERGEWLAIAADRIPVRGEKILIADFLGHPAPFAQGPWLLAGLLGAPVVTLFAVQEKDGYHVYFQEFAEKLAWTRTSREAVIQDAVSRYAQILASMAKRYPYQWYNFYNFWQHKYEEEN